jgi:transcriptional regulator with XRE-family HTH domain
MGNHPNRNKVHDWPEFLRGFRARHELTQKQLADHLMVSARNVENWEAGINVPPAFLKITLQALASQLTSQAPSR